MDAEKTKLVWGSLFFLTAAFAAHLPPNDFYFRLVSVGPFQEDDSCWEELTQNSCKLYYECCFLLLAPDQWLVNKQQCQSHVKLTFFTLVFTTEKRVQTQNAEVPSQFHRRQEQGENWGYFYTLYFSKTGKPKNPSVPTYVKAQPTLWTVPVLLSDCLYEIPGFTENISNIPCTIS